MRWVSLAVVMGCAAEPGSQQLPLPMVPPLNVSATRFAPGGPAEVRVTGAQPGERVYLAHSGNGLGSSVCPPSWGGSCAGLAPPVNVLASAWADSDGVARIAVTIPDVDLPPSAWLQAAVEGNPPRLSRPFSVELKPEPAPWNGVGPRPPGPHLIERGTITAWEISTPTRPAVVTTTLSPQCNTSSSLAPLFAPPAYDPNLFFHFFYELSTDGQTAVQCQSAGLGGCVSTPATITLGVVDNRLSHTFAPDDTFATLCGPTSQQAWEVIDNGATGELRLHESLSMPAGCPQTNDGCEFTHTITLSR